MPSLPPHDATPGAAVHVRFSTRRTSYGLVLVAATADGVCAVSFGDADAPLALELARLYPDATLERADHDLGGWVDAVVAAIEGDAPAVDVPLDVRGTAFQLRVWQTLRTLPAGETVTYGEIAERIGRPTAARAVARACATNHLAVVVPCHRVVREDGELGGYRWGLERKRRLLEQERATAWPVPAPRAFHTAGSRDAAAPGSASR